MKYIITLALVLFVFPFGAKVAVEWTDPEYKDRSFFKIAVFAISDDSKGRNLFEAKVVERLREKRINAIKGNSIFPKIAEARELGATGIIKKLRENNIDGVITMSLVKTNMEVGYQKGQTYSVAAGSEGLGVYWVTHYESIKEPGYFESKKIYLIESNLFDLKEGAEGKQEALVWKGQSELVNPATKYDAAVDFAKPLVKHMVKRKLVKPMKKQ